MTTGCQSYGIYNDIHVRPVSDTINSPYSYGLRVSLGSTAQNNSFWPSITYNETYFRSLNFCASNTPQCIAGQNGEIDVTRSSSWRLNSQYEAKDDSSVYGNLSTIYGTDTVGLWTHYFESSPVESTLIPNFPVTVLSNYTSSIDLASGPGDTLGLGPGSTLLENLYQQKLIATKSYALYVGTGTSTGGIPQNGSLIVGGYDAARFTGPVFKYDQVKATKVNKFSPFKVKISQISLDTAAGQPTDLLRDGGGFDAYLTSSQYPIQLPGFVTKGIARSLNATRTGDENSASSNAVAFNGNLTIRFEGGFSVKFGSQWLSNVSNLVPMSDMNTSGNSLNGSSFNASSDLGESEPAILGLAFLQQVYLLVSHDSQPPSFSLANLNWNAQYVQQQPWCLDTIPQAAVPSKRNSFIQQGLIGAVIAAIIGGLAIIALAAFTLRYMIRKCGRSKDTRQKSKDDSAGKPGRFRSSLQRARFSRRKTVQFETADIPKITTVSGGSIKRVPAPLSLSPVSPMSDKVVDVNVVERSASINSNASSATKVSLSGVTITPIDDKDLAMAPYPRSAGFSSLDFGFGNVNNNSNLQQHISRDMEMIPPYPQFRHSQSMYRSSSIYSTD